MTIVDNTLQVRGSPVRWISWQRMVETKLVITIEMSSQVVGSLVVEHVLVVTGCSPWADWTLAEFLINVLLTTISTETARPPSNTGGFSRGDNTTPALLLSISLRISYILTLTTSPRYLAHRTYFVTASLLQLMSWHCCDIKVPPLFLVGWEFPVTLLEDYLRLNYNLETNTISLEIGLPSLLKRLVKQNLSVDWKCQISLSQKLWVGFVNKLCRIVCGLWWITSSIKFPLLSIYTEVLSLPIMK